MHFLGNLGIDFGLLIAQLINFVLLLFVLTKFVYRPLIKRIEADEASLEKAAVVEAELADKAAKLAEKEKQYMTKSRNQAKEIIAEAEAVAEDIRMQAQQESAAEKEAVIAQINQRLAEVHAHHESR